MIYNPAGLYGGGAFKIDTTAAANYFLKKQAQDQAQEATLNKYFSTLDDKATDKGVRDQEVSSFYKAKQDYQDFYTKNSKALASGTRPDLTREAQRLAKIPFQIASESRNALANTKIIGQVRATSKDIGDQYSMETIGIDQTGKPIIDPVTNSYVGLYANDQPIYTQDDKGQLIKNPNYKAFDLTTDIVLNPKELNGKEMQDFADNQIANVKPTEKPVATKPDPNRKFYDIETIETGYDDTGLKAIGDQMKDLFKDKRINYTWKKQHPFKEWTDQNAAQFTQANDVYKRIYGKDIENDDELYAGIQMANRSGKQVKETSVKNEIAFSNWNRSQNEAASKRIAAYTKKLSDKGELDAVNNAATDFEEILDGTYGTAVKKGDLWYDASGKPLTTAPDQPVRISGEIPKGILKGVPPRLQVGVDYMDLHIKDGIVQGAYNDLTKLITRKDLVGAELKAAGIKPKVKKVENVNVEDANKLGF